MKFFNYLFLLLVTCQALQADSSFAAVSVSNFSKFREVGALFESLPSTAHELCHYIRNITGKNRRILELGAGKGAVTRHIVKYLQKGDTLDVIELDEGFCKSLMQEFPAEKYPQLTIHAADMLKFECKQPYDIIICTLPFNAFDDALVTAMLNKIETFTHSATHMSYIEYVAGSTVRKIGALVSASLEEENHRREQLKKFNNNRRMQSKVVFNLPPTYVHHLCFNNTSQDA